MESNLWNALHPYGPPDMTVAALNIATEAVLQGADIPDERKKSLEELLTMEATLYDNVFLVISDQTIHFKDSPLTYIAYLAATRVGQNALPKLDYEEFVALRFDVFILLEKIHKIIKRQIMPAREIFVDLMVLFENTTEYGLTELGVQCTEFWQHMTTLDDLFPEQDRWWERKQKKL